ncbi:minor capsid protein [Nicoliella lavandulae]|uniref:Minor capsid protein n=1 Tax=Nicoliella lavandulae TaxID=3082954 RepID=A0ABU8SM84_9LACO
MQNSAYLEHQHINQLIAQDNANAKHLDNYYTAAMSIIASHLQDFYREYATDTGLSLTQVSQSVNGWDLANFKQAIDTLMQDVTPDSNLRKRIAVAQAQAMIDKKHTMAAIVGAGIAAATFKAQQYSNQELPNQFTKEFNYRSPTNYQKKQLPSEPKDNIKDFNNRLWVHSDVMVTRTQETLNNALRKGVDQAGMNKLTQVKSQSTKRTSDNLSSSANDLVSRVQIAFRITAINNTNAGKSDAYHNITANYVKWITQEDTHVCPQCEPLDGNVYPVSGAPKPQIDTHFQCRCSTIRCNADGDLQDVYPD